MSLNVITSQTGANQFQGHDIMNHSLFVGGLNVSHHVLRNYSPLVNNYGRLFMVRMPFAILRMFASSDAEIYSPMSRFMQFKHILEYMNRSVTGFPDKELAATGTNLAGGYTNRGYRIPTVVTIPAMTLTIGVYELVGSPVYEVVNGWINGIGDENSGFATYGGHISGGQDADLIERRIFANEGEDTVGIAFNEANHTCEFIYIQTDRSGAQVERAIFLAGCYPQNLPQSVALDNAVGAPHDAVTYDLQWHAVPYASSIVNAIGTDLLRQFTIVSNFLNWNPQVGDSIFAKNNPNQFRRSMGPVPNDSATGNDIGNTPAFHEYPNATTRIVNRQPMDDGRLAGQEGRLAEGNWEGFESASSV